MICNMHTVSSAGNICEDENTC